MTISLLDKQLTIKKSEANMTNHRSPKYCKKIIAEISGFEIIE
jgi:hypothetical protein